MTKQKSSTINSIKNKGFIGQQEASPMQRIVGRQTCPRNDTKSMEKPVQETTPKVWKNMSKKRHQKNRKTCPSNDTKSKEKPVQETILKIWKTQSIMRYYITEKPVKENKGCLKEH